MGRGQVVVLRELLSFAMGVMVMLGIVTIFNTVITPKLQDYSLNEQAYSLLNHVNSLIEKSLILSNEFSDSTVNFTITLPTDLSDNPYRLYVENGQLCVRTRGRASVRRCINYTLDSSLEGNFLSGTEFLISVSDDVIVFDNLIPKLLPVYFFTSCGNGEVVDWNEHTSFLLSDYLTCGCDGTYYAGLVDNPSFETGDISDWTLVNSTDQYVYVTDDPSVDGDYVVYLDSDDTTPTNQMGVFQIIDDFPGGNVSFSVNSHNGTIDPYSFTGFKAQDLDDNKQIYYITHGHGFAAAGAECDAMAPGSDNTYLYCIFTPNNTWTKKVIDPVSDFESIYSLDITGDRFVVGPLMTGQTEAYFDNIRVLDLSDSEYCDLENDGAADGVCFNGSCVSTYLESSFAEQEFFYSEEPLFTIDLKNFNESADCSLSFQGSDYSMGISGDSAWTSLPSMPELTSDEGVVSCQSDVLQNSTGNISSVLLKSDWLFNDSNGLPSTLKEKALVADFFNNIDGEEIIYYNYANNTLMFLSSDGSFITNFSLTNSSDYVQDFQVGDLDYDGDLDLVVMSSNNLFALDNDLSESWSINNLFVSGEGLTLADVDPTSGVEVLAKNGGTNTYCYDKDGNLLWTDNDYYSTGGSDYAPSFPPVVADVDPDNDGLEIILRYLSANVTMLDANSSFIRNFETDDSCKLATPLVVGDVNASVSGLEVFTSNCTGSYLDLMLLDKDFNKLWNHTVRWDDDGSQVIDDYSLRPMTSAFGDVNGDGVNEVIVSFWNYSNNEAFDVNDHLMIFDSNGNLLNDYVTASEHAMMPVLLELYSYNPGLEILTQESDGLKVINYTGQVLQYYDDLNDTAGPINLASDLDGDGLLEVVDLSSGPNKVVSFDTSVNASHNFWVNYNHDFNMTGYQSSFDLDFDQFSCESYNYGWFTLTPSFGSINDITSSGMVNAESVVAADFDGDGDLDVVATAGVSDKLSWWENLGGSFGSEQVIGSGDGMRGIAVGDLDGDGDPDIVSSAVYDDKLSWWENTDGAGSFGPEQVIESSSTNYNMIKIIDFDKDGDLDIVSASDDVDWFENTDGAGSFSTRQAFITNQNFPKTFAFGDVNGDGLDDLFAGSYGSSGTFELYINLGSETFDSGTILRSPISFCTGIDTGDLDGDGDVDVVAAFADDNVISWFENTDGAGSFGSEQIIQSSFFGPNHVILVDLDLDGDLDVVATNANQDHVSYWLNDGSGSFGSEQLIDDTADNPNKLTSADIDGDGDPDIVATIKNNNKVSWWANQGFTGDGVGPCCGDDGLNDDFSNTTLTCSNGRLQ